MILTRNTSVKKALRTVLSLTILIGLFSFSAKADEANDLYNTIRSRVLSVKDYTADVKMKINVNFMRVPSLKGTLYYKSPDKLRLERHGGLSVFPKRNINLSLGNLLPTGTVTVIDMGYKTKDGKKLRILKVIPEDDQSNIILAKIWIDEANMVALRTETTTRNDGTVVMDLEFGSYKSYSLPDKVTVYMDVKDYKLPKGVTMDYYDPNEKPAADKKPRSTKGTIQISYLKYAINTGLSDAVFSKKD